jgi:hypothetical protein
MKRQILIAFVCALAASPALSDMSDVIQIQLQTTGWPYQYGSGGAVFARIIDDDPDGDGLTIGPYTVPNGFEFTTFCVEDAEHVVGGWGTYFGVVNTAAVTGTTVPNTGGYDGGNPIYGDPLGQSTWGDPLSEEVAYLYTQYATGVLSHFDYGDTTEHRNDAGDLQLAIWKLEQETTVWLSGEALEWYDEAIAAVSSDAWSGIGNVRVLNLYTYYNTSTDTVSELRQDILIFVPVPAAGLLGILGLGVAGIKLRKVA